MSTLLRQLISKAVGYATALALFSVIALASPHLAQAAHWHLTGQSPDGLAQQFVDLDSLRGAGDLWTVESYFIQYRQRDEGQRDERQSDEGQRDDPSVAQPTRADYTTKYDCASLASGETHRYKDIAPDGSESEQWGDASADVFNQATMNYVCQYRAAGPA